MDGSYGSVPMVVGLRMAAQVGFPGLKVTGGPWMVPMVPTVVGLRMAAR